MSEYPYEINPFKLATLLELKEESDEVKERIEYLISKKQKKDGRFEFPARYLRAGDLFSTMFGVRILLSYSQYKHYRPNIEKALQYVVEHRGDFNTLRDMGFAVYILARYDFKKYAPIIQELTEQIISKQVNGKWEGSLEDNCWLVIDLLAVRGRFDDKSLNEKIDIVVEKGIRYIKQVSKQFLKIFLVIYPDQLTN